MDKTNQKELAKVIGLNVVPGIIVDVAVGKYVFPNNIQYPCFTKPLISVRGGKLFFNKCIDADELKRLLDKVGLYGNAKILIEEYKNIQKEYAVVGFSNGRDVNIPGIIEFLANSKSHFGIAREGKVLPPDGFETTVSLFKSFISRIGYCGLFDIDFYESDGELFFSELNLRFGGSGYAITKMGVNLPVMFINYLLGKDKDNSYSLIINDTSTFINERMCLDDYVAGYINEKDLWSAIKNSPIKFIYDEIDTAPFDKFKRYCCVQRFNRFRRTFKKRIKRKFYKQ